MVWHPITPRSRSVGAAISPDAVGKSLALTCTQNCQDKFEEVAGSPNFTFMGNVTIGESNSHGGNQSIKLSHLLSNYDAVLFAYGASRDKSLGIPGESTLEGIHSARDFVGWYNGLPECAHLTPDLTTGEEAVIVGQGNVALDVARMLLEDVDTLRKTDIAEHALETLSRSRVRRVHVVGRRGPMQASQSLSSGCSLTDATPTRLRSPSRKSGS